MIVFVPMGMAAAVVCSATAAFSGSPAPARTVQTPNGAAFVDPNGLSLYTYNNDDAGKSNCSGQCAMTWPPLAAEGGASSSGDWTIVQRDDGPRQWAYKGQPLYTFANDTKPGDANGDEFNNVWRRPK